MKSKITQYFEYKLLESIKSGNLKVFKRCLKHVDPNMKDANGDPVIQFAILRDNFDMVNLLIERGANVDNKLAFYADKMGAQEKILQLINLEIQLHKELF